jgi:hypothetical protein
MSAARRYQPVAGDQRGHPRQDRCLEMHKPEPEVLEEIRSRIAAGQASQSQEAKALGVRQPQLSEWLSGKKPMRKSARLSLEQKRELVTAVQVDGMTLKDAAAKFGQTVRGAGRVLRDWGWDSDRGSADVEIAPILSDGKPGSIWPDAFEVRRKKTTGDVVIRCQPGYRSNGTQPKMPANGTVRLRVVGDSQHQNDVFDVRELAKDAFRTKMQAHKPDERPWRTYFALRNGTYSHARTEGGKAAVGDGLVELIKIGSTQGPIGSRIGPETMHPDECVVLAVLPGLDKKDHHPKWAGFQLRRGGPGCEFFEFAGPLRQYVESLPHWEGELDDIPELSHAGAVGS